MTHSFLPWAKPNLLGNEKAMLIDALESSWISGGPYVERLERELAEAMYIDHALAVSNGTTALELALRGLGIGQGDEVIVPGFTFVAAANMVVAVGATPVACDVDPETWLLDASKIAPLCGPRTKAVLPVHLYGNVADMDAICESAGSLGLAVIEDTAEATFSRYKNRFAGTLGDVGTFSMHATKTITTGEGGLVVTHDDALAADMRKLRDHGMNPTKRYWHDVAGHNFRLTNLQASLGCAQLEKLDEILADRRRIHASYRARLKGVEGIRLQRFNAEVDPVLWAMTVQLTDTRDLETVRARRDTIMAGMAEQGIETRPGFYALSMMSQYECLPSPHAMHVSASIISPPTFPGLTDAEIDRVCDRLIHCLNATKQG
ncbi:DegT/DnrJ/EryC1/StrS family aminotransferase [Roseobacter litoralis]|uniref:UDP-4-amino-4-deoxy-L-arabinose--oxoglutarate aminotransferase ArnB n=1 Tax=Roseobacter litoralis (strain ATCC 49566 / DSM 6996 / JCM 21268 / NBRC 15278 / OCh 149) TaxID=391595 RepID=F7ZJ76_ROSLO|nr:DegT/DnrJ/EryC1/StrS family aminotransferase [Roseobacter litoralis]AEI96321.1 UDP-4-amino-4-deoxy-L-arabinose--oxoglutarate aminotransferase ArnB [Roseobacter litoralis Och 149]